MTSTVGSTLRGRTSQITRAYRGMADEMKHKKAVQAADCDQPQTLEQALRVIADLQNRLADAQTLIEEMRAAANSDQPDVPAVASSKPKYWDTKRVAKESGVAICTICRNVEALGGFMMDGGWWFPANTTYGKKRSRK